MNDRQNMRTTHFANQTTVNLDACRRAGSAGRARIGNTPLFNARSAMTCRDYLKNLRAAEMAAWEQTGGDYLVSCNRV